MPTFVAHHIDTRRSVKFPVVRHKVIVTGAQTTVVDIHISLCQLTPDMNPGDSRGT